MSTTEPSPASAPPECDVASGDASGGLGYQPALDGVRAAAVILVMVHHAGLFGLPGGGLVGVESFFVLSGFLITALLIGERGTSGRVSLGSFYARRALRLFPALFAMVVDPIDLFPRRPYRRP